MAEQRTDASLVTPKKNKVLPHHLKPSSGSCHDFCKFGTKHIFEEKPWKSSRKRMPKPLHSELATVEIFVSGEPKKEKIVKPKLSIDTSKHSLILKVSPGIKSLSPKSKISLVAKSHSPRRNASSGDNKKLPKFKSSFVRKSFSPDPPEVIKREILPPSEQVEVPAQEDLSTDMKLSKTKKRTGYQSGKPSPPLRSKLVNVKVPLSSLENSDGAGRRNDDVKTDRMMPDLKASAEKALKSTDAPLSPKVTRTKKVSFITRKARCSKLASPRKDQNNLVRVETKTSDEENVPEKTLHVIETGKASAKKALKSADAPLSPKVTHTKKVSVITRKARCPKLASPRKDQNSLVRVETKTSGEENVPEKTLHVIETGTQSDSLDTVSDDISRGKSPSLLSHEKHDDEIDNKGGDSDELVSSDNISLKDENAETVIENGKKTLIKSKVILSDEKCRSPVKLKFRSGKLVDLMSDNNNTRRLRFRKRKVVGAASSKADVSSKTYKKTGDGGATDAKLSSEKVVLKHQDVQGKKDDQRLFNNVIEETASKLVKSRKSKVKALVGAFETVISLQEKTPSSHTVS